MHLEKKPQTQCVFVCTNVCVFFFLRNRIRDGNIDSKESEIHLSPEVHWGRTDLVSVAQQHTHCCSCLWYMGCRKQGRLTPCWAKSTNVQSSKLASSTRSQSLCWLTASNREAGRQSEQEHPSTGGLWLISLREEVPYLLTCNQGGYRGACSRGQRVGVRENLTWTNIFTKERGERRS